MEPQKDEKSSPAFGADAWQKIANALRATSPEHPITNYECLLRCDGQPCWHRIIAQSMWSAEDSPGYVGAIGKIVDIHDSRVKLEDLEKRASHDMLTGLFEPLQRPRAHPKQDQKTIQRKPIF